MAESGQQSLAERPGGEIADRPEVVPGRRPDVVRDHPSGSVAQDRTVANTAAVVNRTHRVVRERAGLMQKRRSRLRSLGIPLAVCAAFVLMGSHSLWSLLEQYDFSTTGVAGLPDASAQFLPFLLWFLPVIGALLALAWRRRVHNQAHLGRTSLEPGSAR